MAAWDSSSHTSFGLACSAASARTKSISSRASCNVSRQGGLQRLENTPQRPPYGPFRGLGGGEFACTHLKVVQSTSIIKSLGFREFGNRRGLGGEPGPHCFPKPPLPCRTTPFRFSCTAIPPLCPVRAVGRVLRSTRILVGQAILNCTESAVCP